MLPNKSYCFINCYNEDDAKNIFDNMHGHAKLGQNETIIYLSYIKEIPEAPNQYNQDLPEGLIIINDFVSADEERILLEAIRMSEEPLENNLLKHRRVKHFGYEFLYGINNVDPEKPLEENIPVECDTLWKRLEDKVPDRLALVPDQLTVNIYESGQGKTNMTMKIIFCFCLWCLNFDW